jgi:SAM domain (Sterile alpha motif)
MAAAEDLQRTLADLGLEHYLPNCLQAGFYSFQSLSSITEAELTALGLRLGHRRKLLRKIARDNHWPDNRPLPTSYSELQRHRNTVRRLARGYVDPDTLEENCYSLTSPSQSPSPWSRDASSSSDSIASNQESLDGSRPQLVDVLQTSSRLFPIAVSLARPLIPQALRQWLIVNVFVGA